MCVLSFEHNMAMLTHTRPVPPQMDMQRRLSETLAAQERLRTSLVAHSRYIDKLLEAEAAPKVRPCCLCRCIVVQCRCIVAPCIRQQACGKPVTQASKSRRQTIRAVQHRWCSRLRACRSWL